MDFGDEDDSGSSKVLYHSDIRHKLWVLCVC